MSKLEARVPVGLDTLKDPRLLQENLCSGFDPQMWFPEGQREWAAVYTTVQQVCGACPVADLCRDYAASTKQRFGVWAGEWMEDPVRAAKAKLPAERETVVKRTHRRTQDNSLQGMATRWLIKNGVMPADQSRPGSLLFKLFLDANPELWERVPHGTLQGYVRYGCREDCCRKIGRANSRARRAARKAEQGRDLA